MATRKKKGGIPTAGTRAAGVVQLAPKVRGIESGRIRKANRQQFAPQVEADKAAIRGVHQSFGREKDSILGATDMAENSLDAALRSLGSSGLAKGYAGQASRELGARRADVASSIPFLLADAAQEREEGLATARQELMDTRASRESETASEIAQRFKELRNTAASEFEERADRKRTKREEAAEGEGISSEDSEALKNASTALQIALTDWKNNVPIDEEDPDSPRLQEVMPLETVAQWRKFAKVIADNEPEVSLADVWGLIQERLKGRPGHGEAGRGRYEADPTTGYLPRPR